MLGLWKVSALISLSLTRSLAMLIFSMVLERYVNTYVMVFRHKFVPANIMFFRHGSLSMILSSGLPKVPFDLTLAFRWEILEVMIGAFFLVLTVLEIEESDPEINTF